MFWWLMRCSLLLVETSSHLHIIIVKMGEISHSTQVHCHMQCICNVATLWIKFNLQNRQNQGFWWCRGKERKQNKIQSKLFPHEGVSQKARTKTAERLSSFKETVICNVIIQHIQLHSLTTNVVLQNDIWGYISGIKLKSFSPKYHWYSTSTLAWLRSWK